MNINYVYQSAEGSGIEGVNHTLFDSAWEDMFVHPLFELSALPMTLTNMHLILSSFSQQCWRLLDQRKLEVVDQPPYSADEIGSLKLRRGLLEFDLLCSMNHHHLGCLLGVCHFANSKCVNQPCFQRLTNETRGFKTYHYNFASFDTGRCYFSTY